LKTLKYLKEINFENTMITYQSHTFNHLLLLKFIYLSNIHCNTVVPSFIGSINLEEITFITADHCPCPDEIPENWDKLTKLTTDNLGRC
jgi:hypothetical protein